MRRVVYASRVGRQVRYADAEGIAKAASARNALAELTGILLYTPSHFIQLLEGDESAIRSTLARIRKDPRHSELRIIDDVEVDSREFGAWAMVARHISMLPAEIERLDAARALLLLRATRDAKDES